MARKPENIPGYDRLSPRAKLILTGQSVYDIPVDQRGTVFPTSPTPPTPSKPPKPKAPIGEFKLNMSQMREKIGNLALTNQYAVNVPIPPEVKKYIETFSSENNEEIEKFISNKLGFLCSEATLPVSSYATAEVKDNYLGITQEFAHTRLYTDLDFTFYVDDNYLSLRFFELWMDYISSGAEKEIILKNPAAYTKDFRNYYRRFTYPHDYKSDTMTITKFERDHKKTLEYTFINVFPKGLTSIPVSYGSADLLKVTVTFNFDRYIVKRVAAAAEVASTSGTKKSPVQTSPNTDGTIVNKGGTRIPQGNFKSRL